MQDARDRIRPAVEHAGLEWPLRRVVVNLAPGNLRKDGPGLDLPIAVAVLAATAQVPEKAVAGWAFAGELSLKGEVLSTPGVLSVAIAAARAGLDGVVVPAANALEAAQIEGLKVVGVQTLRDVAGFLKGTWTPPPAPTARPQRAEKVTVDLAEISGQIAGPAGAGGGGGRGAQPAHGGLARRRQDHAGAAARHHPARPDPRGGPGGQPAPFRGRAAGGGGASPRPPVPRAPPHGLHHRAAGGGSSVMRPGEVSLAHHGVLFLDELTEFRRDAIEALRQPLEDGRVVVTRVAGSVEFPARFTLVAAANPCPCGYDGDARRHCRCPEGRILQYRQKLSGPLLDRIDLRLRVPRLTKQELLGSEGGEPSALVRDRVQAARERQRHRYASMGALCNAHLPGRPSAVEARLDTAAEDLLARAVDTLALTGRGFDRALKVARTVADLGGSPTVAAEHLAEALSYRTGFEGEEEDAVRAG